MLDIENFIENIVDTSKEPVEESNKRDYLKNLVNQGKASLLDGKTLWTEERLNKASDKTINKLYKSIVESSSVNQKDLISKFSGVDNFQNMMAI